MLSEHMSPTKKRSALDNPFASRFVTPGAIPYFFNNAETSHQIINRGNDLHWVGQIVGPHGSGKTTLARHLGGQLQQRFHEINFLIVRGIGEIKTCHRIENGSSSVATTPDWNQNKKTLYVIDGVERLSWLQRKLIVADCRRKQIGLIVTTHRRLIGLPELYKTSFDKSRFIKVLHHLGTERYADHYDRLRSDFGENCREMLFELYDEHLDHQFSDPSDHEDNLLREKTHSTA